MSGRVAALCGILGAAAAGVWFQRTRLRRASSPDRQWLGADQQGMLTLDVDDDEVAEIIRRARPALERARELH